MASDQSESYNIDRVLWVMSRGRTFQVSKSNFAISFVCHLEDGLQQLRTTSSFCPVTLFASLSVVKIK